MSQLPIGLLAVAFGLAMNPSLAQNAEWKEGQFPGHDRTNSSGQQHSNERPGADSHEMDSGQRTNETVERSQNQATPSEERRSGPDGQAGAHSQDGQTTGEVKARPKQGEPDYSDRKQ